MNIEQFVLGDTMDFNVEVPDYPASEGYTLTYVFIPLFSTPTQAAISINAITADDGVTYDVQESPAVTATWKAGDYTWARYVSKSGIRHALTESGQVTFKPDPAQMVQGDESRTHAKKVLDAIEAVIENRASLDQENYTIAGRSLSRTPIAELEKLRAHYKAEVDAEWRVRSGSKAGTKLVFKL